MMDCLTLNERALRLADEMAANAGDLRLGVQTVGGARILDCGIATEGGLQAGLGLARICMAGLGEVTLAPGTLADLPCPLVQVTTDQPVLACMASQYAGWQIAVDKYFAMGSGPMRAVYGKEELFDHIPGRERAPAAVGVLETREPPTEAVLAFLSERLNLPPEKLTLLVAPTASQAGTIQVVARTVETALHKLFELKFDLRQVVSGFGVAPLPPVAAKDRLAIGRTNDAVLYGGHVVLWVRASDDLLAEIGPRVPSSSSADHGAPFTDIFERYGRQFYKIDPLLFSPAVVTFQNLTSGRTHTFGRLEVDILKRSFLG
ncbi:MAG TPA: methenyltetrahydromethanopterin cyclohydrolase [Gemmataceae bacterium]|nr:methenyltetrahydromethanopterin cyclohydrolase [Gemmataceae bacterium]